MSQSVSLLYQNAWHWLSGFSCIFTWSSSIHHFSKNCICHLHSNNSVEQSPWVTNKCLASQEITCPIWNLKACYCVHKSLPLDPILSQMNSPHTLTSLRSIMFISRPVSYFVCRSVKLINYIFNCAINDIFLKEKIHWFSMWKSCPT